MFNPLTSSSSSLSFSPYVEGQDPTKFLVMAHQELSLRYLQERLMAPSVIGGAHGSIVPTPLATHFFPGRDHYSLFSPFLSNPVVSLPTTSALVHNPFPASTKLSSLQEQKQLNSLLQSGNCSNFSSYLASQTTSQLPVLAPSSMSHIPKDFMGSFQVKNFSATSFNPFYNPLSHLLTTNPKKESLNTALRKHNRWSVAHVRIAWEIHLDQQRKIQSTTREERKEEIPNQSVGSKLRTSSDIQLAKKRKMSKLEKEISDLQHSSASDDHQVDNIIPEKKKFPKQTHDHALSTSATSPKILEHLALASNNERPASSQPQIHTIGRSDSNQKNEINCQISILGSSSRIKDFSSSGNSPDESLISLLKTTDIYASIPGVVSSVSNQSLPSFPHHRQLFKLNL